MQSADDNWAEGTAYEGFMGRWSRSLAVNFIHWLNPSPRLHWLDIGCGTGALSKAIIQSADPELVIACDPSERFITFANTQQHDERLSFQVTSLEHLPLLSEGFELIVSGLVLNFISDPVDAIHSMMQRSKPGGQIAAYVWDYAGRMDFLRTFWDTAISLNPPAKSLDEGERFPLYQPEIPENTFQEAVLVRVKSHFIDIPTVFNSVSDYWDPFLAGTDPAPNYVTSLKPKERYHLAATLKQRLNHTGDGKIKLIARAWVISGELN